MKKYGVLTIIILLSLTAGCLGDNTTENKELSKEQLVPNESSFLINIDGDSLRNNTNQKIMGEISSESMKAILQNEDLINSTESAIFFSNSSFIDNMIGMTDKDSNSGIIINESGINKKELYSISNISIIERYNYQGNQIVKMLSDNGGNLYLSDVENQKIVITKKEESIKSIIDSAYEDSSLSEDVINKLQDGNNIVFKPTEGKMDLEFYTAEYSISEDEINFSSRLLLNSEDSAESLKKTVDYIILTHSYIGSDAVNRVLDDVKVKAKGDELIINYEGNPEEIVDSLEKIQEESSSLKKIIKKYTD